MATTRDWGKSVRRMEQLLRLKTFPVAFKLLENRADLSAIPYMRRVGHKSTLCQLINLVRSFDWTVGADDTDMGGPDVSSIIGLTGMPEFLRMGRSGASSGPRRGGTGKSTKTPSPGSRPGSTRPSPWAPGLQPLRSGHGPHLTPIRPR